jgi:phosphate/phosphite/phosphonate ABC transporter binding protein
MSQMQTKIIAIVVVTLVIGFGILVYMSMRKERADLIESNHSKTDLVASSVISSIGGIMMTGDPQATGGMIQDLRGVEGISEVRLFGNDGKELYLDGKYKPLGGKLKGAVDDSMVSAKTYDIIEGSDMTVVKPLIKAERCTRCHTTEARVLGVVAVKISLAGVYAEIERNRMLSILNAAATVLGVVIILALMIRTIVLKPVKMGVNTMGDIEKNKDLTHRMQIASKDEMGRLASSFNSLIESVQKVIKRINRMSYQVGSVSAQIVVSSSKVMEGAQVQARSAESTSGAIEQMNASIKEVSESAESMLYSSELTSSSIFELSASIDEIAGSSAVLSSSVDSTVSSITQITASIKEVSTSVAALSDAAETSVDFISTIARSISEVESAAKDSADLSEKVTEAARELEAGAMGRAISGMRKIRDVMDDSGEVINRLDNRSRQIGEILTVIDEVTEQTELLSLNAAILASQAGEHGKGFAVVADEIKDLAERTASSTHEITKLINTVQSEVAEAVRSMDLGMNAVGEGQAAIFDAKKVLEGIVSSSARSTDMSKQIENATKEQAVGAGQVREAMVNIRDMVMQILRATQDLTNGSEQIMQEAEKVRDVAFQVRTASDEQSKGSAQIIRAVENVTDHAQQIAHATKEQSKGSDEIVIAIEKIREVTQENEDLASEMTTAVEELAMHIEGLKDEVSTFRIEDAGSGLVKLGIVPLESPAQMYKKFQPLAEYLSQKIGREVVFKLTPTFSEAVRDIGTGAADICYMTPSTYIEAHEKYGVELMAKAVRNGVPYSHTMIVTRKDSQINTIDDLKGRKFAFGDKMSTSSYLVPLYMLSRAGVKLSDLSEHRFLGHHDDVAKAVLLGEYDAGGIRETTAYQFMDKGLRLVKTSEDIPEFNICARPGIDAELKTALKNAVLALVDKDTTTARVLKSIDRDYTGFMDADDRDYDGVRVMMKKV